MDTLDIIKKAEKEGGEERRKTLEEVLISARQMGCDMKIGGGRAGGMNIRYGAIGYAVLDINTKGVVKLYASPHPGKDPKEAHRTSVNDFVEANAELELKSSPINTYGHLEAPVEEIGSEPLVDFIKHSLGLIRKYYYEPWLELHEA